VPKFCTKKRACKCWWNWHKVNSSSDISIDCVLISNGKKVQGNLLSPLFHFSFFANQFRIIFVLLRLTSPFPFLLFFKLYMCANTQIIKSLQTKKWKGNLQLVTYHHWKCRFTEVWRIPNSVLLVFFFKKNMCASIACWCISLDTSKDD
jgi:hypothetical protein